MKEKLQSIIYRNIRFIQDNSVFVFILFFGTIIRGYWAFNHFTHYDDVGLINCIIAAKMNNKGLIYVLNYGWTYGFFQIIFSMFLVNINYSYSFNIFLGRVPSLISGIINIYLIYIICSKYIFSGKNKKYLSSIITLLYTISWENIIYSSQAEPYEIGITVILLIFLFAFSMKEQVNSLYLVFITVLSAYTQYTLVIPIASLYIMLFNYAKNKKDVFISAITSMFFIYYYIQNFMDKGLFGRGINWNAGIDGRFLFHIQNDSIKEKIIYSIMFFAKNTMCIIRNFFVSNQYSLYIYSITFVILCLVLLGLYEIHVKKIKICIFIDCMIIFLILFVLFGKITFGPSRHLLFFYPVVLFLLAYGINIIYDNKKKYISIYRYSFMIVFLIGIIVSWIQSSLIEWNIRKNLFLHENESIEKYIDDIKPRYIIFYNDTMGYIFPDLNEYEKIIYEPLGKTIYLNKKNSNYFMYIGQSSPLDGNMITYLNELEPLREMNIASKLIYKYEKQTSAEIEYASDYYQNSKNGLYIYVYE